MNNRTSASQLSANLSGAGIGPAATLRRTPIRTAGYWVSTALAALAFASLGAANLAHAAPIVHGLTHLGYPAYFATIIGSWKLLAAIALLAPRLDRAKEWAYAGMFFTLTGA